MRTDVLRVASDRAGATLPLTWVTGAAPVLVCELQDVWAVHDHVLLVARVVDATVQGAQRPLVHHRRAAHTLAPPEPDGPARA